MNVPGGSMVTMNNTAQGGPVGSAPMINQAAARQQQDQESERRLNTYIFDYLCKNHHYDLARSFSQHCPIIRANGKPKANGVDDSMDTDSKEDAKRPDDLPYPNIPHHPSENAFLYDWWCQFWDIFGAARNRGGAPNTETYLHHNMAQTKLRQMQQQQMLNQTGGNNLLQMQQFRMNMPPNGMNNMQKQAMQNSRPGAPNAMMQQKMMQQNAMQRDGSIGDNRPQSPNTMGGNAPSPSKRPRTDDGGFNPGPAGRGQPMQGGQLGTMTGGPNGSMMLQNGMPSEMSQQQMNAFPQNPNGQQKSLEAMSANGGAQGPLGQNNMEGFAMDRSQLPNGGAGGSQGNHALQDYQMQLMLLEQQNKKRLLMARQEQDNINHVPGSTPGQGGPFAQNMSPSGSRAGPSPNPNDQMRKIAGTPKMNQNVPGSPAMPGDMQNRGTPPGNAYHEMPGVLRQQMFNGNNPAMMGQPPSSHPGFNIQMAGQMNPQNMEQMRMANGGRMPNGQQWATNGQQMMQQGQGPQGQGTPQQRNMTMPPPPAPNPPENQRTQPSSPAQVPAPPTPNQTAKANPKGKKEGAATKKQPQKAANKKGAAAATPSESNEPPATPTPSTPITPMHQQSFNPNGKTNGQPPQPAAQPPQPANHMDTFSTDLGQDSGNFALDFAVDGPDVLENFDFDSFLHNTDDNNGFGNFDLMTFDSISSETPAGS